jgi:arylesterase/paraoxonase
VDIAVDSEKGIAYVAGSSRVVAEDQAPNTGAIFTYSPGGKGSQVTELTTDFEGRFNPSGLGLLTGPSGDKYLFVVNEGTDQSSVELFEVEDSRLTHSESINGEPIYNAVDILPVGPNSFYLTISHTIQWGFMRTVRDILGFGDGMVLYFDGEEFREAAGGLSFASGINISPDGTTIYVAEMFGSGIQIFQRDLESGHLKGIGEIPLGTGTDRIEVAENGDLWVGVHPNLLVFRNYLERPSRLSPARILRIRSRANGDYESRAVYEGDGDYLSAASVGVKLGQYLLIGSVLDQRFLVCRLLPEEEPD